MGAPKLPGDVQRLLDWEELPPSVRDIDADFNPIANGIMMAHQTEAITLSHIHNLLVIPKGRRTGITYAFGHDDAITASATPEAGGDNIYYIGDTKEKGLEYIGYVAHMARVMGAAMADGFLGIEVFLFDDIQPDGSTKQITSYRVRFASGHEVVALSSNPANIRGLQGKVRIDEAAYHRNVQAVLDAATALLIWGGSIVIISTHNGANNPFNKLIKDARDGLNAFHVFEVTFDDAVSNGLYERVCLRNGWTPSEEGKKKWYLEIRGAYGNNKEAMLEELDVIPREGTGVAIPRIWIEKCMPEVRPILRLSLEKQFALKPEAEKLGFGMAWIESNLKPLMQQLDPLREHCFGTDYARHRDFSVISPGAIQQDMKRKVPFQIEMHNVPTRQQEQILWYMIDHLPRFTVGAMDATGSGQTIAEYTADKYGHDRIHQINLNNAWYKEHMGSFQNAFEDQMFDLPKDADITNDVAGLRLVDGIIKPPKINIRDIKQPDLFRHLDSAISLALLWYASRQDSFPIDFASTGSRTLSDSMNINKETGFGTVGGGSDLNGFIRSILSQWLVAQQMSFRYE